MKRVLVTGASGFIGRHCLPALQQRGFEVVAVSSRHRSAAEPMLQWQQADLLDGEQSTCLIRTIRPTHLLHLAWFVKPGAFWSSPQNLCWLEASMTLLRSFQQYHGWRAVVVGTCAEYDWESGICHETVTPLRPQTIYGKCKHALGLYLSCLAEQTGLSAAWARLFFLYGPHAPLEKFPQPVLAAFSRGVPALCTHGQQLRDFLHVQDVADALASLVDSEVQGPLNIASGTPIRLADIAEGLAERMGRMSLLKLGALPERSDEPATLVADVCRLQEELDWRPQFDLESGLEHLVHWWKRRTTADVSV